MTDAFILAGVRTPVGRYGGALSQIRTDDLLGSTMVAGLREAGVDLDRIEDIAAGCVNPAHEGWAYIAAGPRSPPGFPVSVPAATVNRLLRVVADLHDPDRARDPQRRARRRPGRRRGIDVASGWRS